MPSFYYSATFDESLEMLRDLAASGLHIIPSGPFDAAPAPQYASVDDALRARLRQGPGFELCGEFTRHPVALQQLAGWRKPGKRGCSNSSQAEYAREK